MLRWFFGLLLVAALAVGGLVYWRTTQFVPDAPPTLTAMDAAPAVTVKPEDAATHLGQAIRFKTVSVQAGQPWDEAPFADRKRVV